VQDTITHGRVTLQLGIRYDYNKDVVQAASIVANPLAGPWLQGINFPGADPGVAFNNFSPRVGLTYDLSGSGKTIARANYARYYGQVGNGGVADAGEVQVGPNGALITGNWSPANPAATVSANSVDPNLKNDTTDEIIVGVDHEVGAGFAVGANYIWRRYGNFSWNDRPGIQSSNYVPIAFTPAASACPAGATCPTVTYFQPTFQNPTILFETNIPDYNRTYNGVELTGRKRLSNRWLMNTSFAYNSTIVNFGSFGGSQPRIDNTTISEDPSNRDQRNGHQYDYLTSGSGIANVYVNAKWLFKLSGMYQAPLGLNVSAFYNTRQGYPQEKSVLTPSRLNGVTTQIDILLNPVGDTRLPNYQDLDIKFARPVRFGTTRWSPELTVFNVFNSNTVQAIRSRQNASNANFIQAVVAPRVVQFGVRVNF